MRKHFSSAIILFWSATTLQNSVQAQASEIPSLVSREPVQFHAPIQDKNFYLLSLLESTPDIAKTLAGDSLLASITEGKLSSEATCNIGPLNCIGAASFSSEQMALVSARLLEILQKTPQVKAEIATPMRRSGLFELYATDGDADLLSRAWLDAAQGINRILGVYGKGQPPRYPEIDSHSFEVASTSGKKIFGEFAARMAAIHSSQALAQNELWFQPPLQLALLLLKVNKRDEAGRFEPLEKGENAGAMSRLVTVQWNKYPYSVIVVPGLGPEQAGIALDPGAFNRIALAAKRYREGLAPFILVSGGYVHPSQTRFCEAIEMKRALITGLGIPADSILIEPHARHTTTNLRNASRLLYRYKFPLDRPALITTDEAQTHSIRSPEFLRRNEGELGYLPFRDLKPISPTDTAFYVEIDSLQADSSDPLDP